MGIPDVVYLQAVTEVGSTKIIAHMGDELKLHKFFAHMGGKLKLLDFPERKSAISAAYLYEPNS